MQLHKLYRLPFKIKNKKQSITLKGLGFMSLIQNPTSLLFLRWDILNHSEFDLNQTEPTTGFTPLHYAVYYSDVMLTRWLLKNGADINVENRCGKRADEVAAVSLEDDSSHCICTSLIRTHRRERISQLHAKIQKDTLQTSDLTFNELFLVDEAGETLIFQSIKHHSIKSLEALLNISNKQSVNGQSPVTGQTYLSKASELGYLDAVNLLLRHGADVGIKDIRGWTALRYAVSNQHLSVVNALLSDLTYLTDLNGASLFTKNELIQRKLTEAQSRRQACKVSPVLFECAVTNNTEKLFLTLEEEDQVNVTNKVGDWPLYLAVLCGHTEMVQFLCQKGADYLRVHPNSGNSVLHTAASAGHATLVSYFIHLYKTHNIDVRKQIDAVNKLNKTALQLAVEKQNKKCVELLVEEGASPIFIDNYLTAQTLHDSHLKKEPIYDSNQKQIYELLSHKRRDLCNKLLTCFNEWFGFKKFVNIWDPLFHHYLRDVNGDTILMHACRHSHRKYAAYILKSAVLHVNTHVNNCNKHDNNPDHTVLTDYSSEESDVDSGTDLLMENPFSDISPPLNDSPERSKSCTPVPNTYSGSDRFKPSKRLSREVIKEVPKIPKHMNTGSYLYLSEEQSNNCSELPKSTDFDLDIPFNSKQVERLLRDRKRILRDSTLSSDHCISHVCAVNLKDGRSALHRVIESGDDQQMARLLLTSDPHCVNIQDAEGLTPLHLACLLDRKKTVKTLCYLPYVDVNARTLDGNLPQELTTNRQIQKSIEQSRLHNRLGAPDTIPFPVGRSSQSVYSESTFQDRLALYSSDHYLIGRTTALM